MKSRGPSTEPWGTPETTSGYSSRCFSANCDNLRSLSQVAVDPVVDLGAELKTGELTHQVTVWDTVKCFPNIEKYSEQISLPSSSCLSKSWVSEQRAEVVDLLGMKPH